jgi:glycosyltransferase involved in cell wall biosynthesis
MAGKFNYYKILFFPKWYPNRNDAYHGIFIRKHALAIAKHCQLAVIYAGGTKLYGNTYEIEINEEDGFKEIKVYYQNSISYFNPFVRFTKAFRYYRALWMGFNIYRKSYGMPHIIHVHVLTRPALLAWMLKKFKKIPYIITEHFTGYMPQHSEYKGALKKFFDRIFVREAAAVTTVSAILMESMKMHGLHGNYKVVPNVISQGPVLERKGLRAINVSDLVDEMKNVSGLIKACSEIIKKYPELTLEIVGEGPDKHTLIRMVEQLGLSNNVVFSAPVPNDILLKKIASASFLVVNSRYESFSVVAAEALACGVPVLSTKCGGPEEFINPDNGLLIENDNEIELEKGLEFMINNLSRFDSKKLQNFAQERFSEEAVSEKFKALYEQSLKAT